MPRPCYCHKGRPYAGDKCYFCYLMETNSKYKKAWAGQPILVPSREPGPKTPVSEIAKRFKRKPCKFLGGAAGRTVKCKTCTKTMDVPLMACSLFSVCTENVLAQGYPCCSICDKREDSTE